MPSLIELANFFLPSLTMTFKKSTVFSYFFNISMVPSDELSSTTIISKFFLLFEKF